MAGSKCAQHKSRPKMCARGLGLDNALFFRRRLWPRSRSSRRRRGLADRVDVLLDGGELEARTGGHFLQGLVVVALRNEEQLVVLFQHSHHLSRIERVLRREQAAPSKPPAPDPHLPAHPPLGQCDREASGQGCELIHLENLRVLRVQLLQGCPLEDDGYVHGGQGANIGQALEGQAQGFEGAGTTLLHQPLEDRLRGQSRRRRSSNSEP